MTLSASKIGPAVFTTALALGLAASLLAQPVNSAAATLLVGGSSGTVSAPTATLLPLVLRGAPGQPVFLIAGGAGGSPLVVPGLGSIGPALPWTVVLDGLTPGNPLLATSFLDPVLGELALTRRVGAAPEMIQAAVGDPGSAFGLSLTAWTTITPTPPSPVPNAVPRIARSPYLERPSPNSILLTFRYATSAPVTVDVGTDGVTWPSSFSGVGNAIEHSIAISGLAANTEYRYRLRSGASVVLDGPALRFRTAPNPGSTDLIRFAAFGDSGSNESPETILATALYEDPRPLDLVLHLGDLVYPEGQLQYYDDAFFFPYQGLLGQVTFSTVPGNHDYTTSSGSAYFATWHSPETVPGVETYYSFDWGQIHFAAIDSELSLVPGSPMLTWLAQDLAQSTQPWKIVYFHSAPYSGGTHSDDLDVRALVVPIVEAANVDLVLTGHSHVMERTFLLRNHGIVQSHVRDYDKSQGQLGTLYCVSGAGGGHAGYLDTNPNHPLMAWQLGGTKGVLLLEVKGGLLRGRYVDPAGAELDRFSVRKSADQEPPRPVRARTHSLAFEVVLSFDEPVEDSALATGALSLGNYLLGGTVPPSSAALSADGRDVTLRFPSLRHLENHTILGMNVRDLAQNPMAGTVLPLEDDPGQTILPRGATWRYRAQAGAALGGWQTRDFDDSTWSQGPAPLGYGAPTLNIATPLLVQGIVATAYFRHEFHIDDPAEVTDFRLRLNYDDGCVVFLNGVEIARRGVPIGQASGTLARGHESGTFEPFTLTNARRYLGPGRNVLAVEVHNTTLTSSDLVWDGEVQIRGPRPPIRIYVNGAKGDDAVSRAAVSVAAPLDFVVETSPNLPSAPLHLLVSLAIEERQGLLPLLTPPASTLTVGLPDTQGRLAWSLPPLPPALVGFEVFVQAVSGASSRPSAAWRLAFAP